ncbi:hypothetical protein SEUCBS139899_001819 [Sporothrix eucalyptigena]|uniref:Calpain catalytic domain-containing protein n=1 Tax=Sporothrix eucalyptigena TaxID=1812306 RepID=A0ABP0CQH8_9PEZI
MYTRNRRLIKEDSSDSESDQNDVEIQKARRRWAARGSPSTDSTTAADKKKKKKKLPPQESIDKIWERFSQKRFSKAMKVLPFSPVAPSPLSERANELLSVGYERAAEECRRKVKKIIQECRRVNMRYRDPGWDIDWDLKMSKGDCLNSLGETTFDVSLKNMVRISASVPKAVKRVHEIFEKPTFMKTLSGSDVKQGSLGDCWFISCVSGLANVPGGLQRACVEYDTKIGIYGFVFYRDGEWIYSIIDDKLYLTSPSWDSPSFQRDLLSQIDQDDIERVYRKTYQTGSKALFFAQNKDQNETWLPLMEKAYAKAHGDYDSLTGGWIGEGLEDLTGGVTTELLMSDIFDTDSFWDNELSRVNEEFLFGCTTGLLDGGYGDRDGITEGHAYNIMEAKTLKNGTRLLKLRNPWGKVKAGTWEGAWSDGSKEWTTETKEEVGHTFGSDSTFWISYEDFMLKFQNVDRTRLFRDPDWLCCQRWIGVDVPWKTSYNEKFHIKLTKESPLVLVLSQLDSRYFQGLTGQYYFRLHFRLHEQDRPGAEDYIVRSHGNYLMDRSVSVELPSMEPGNYSIFLSVVAERESKKLSVEDVVKRELKKRVENEKLAQVGQAYDLAHSKAAAHLEELAKLRKKSDQVKASDERKRERRKDWAKRHLLKDIQKRQQKKNDEKTKARAAAAKEEERKKKDAEEAAEKKKKDEAEAEEKKKKAEEANPKDKESQTESPPAPETEKKDAEKDKKDTETAESSSVQADLQASAATVVGTATSASTEDDVISASTSGSSTPLKTPLDTPKSETITEPMLDAAGGDLVIVPPVTEEASTAQPHTDSDEKADEKAAEASTEMKEEKPAEKPDDKPTEKVEKSEDKAAKSDEEADGKGKEAEEKKDEKEKAEEKKDDKNKADKDSKSGDETSSSKSDSSKTESKTKTKKTRAPPPPPPPPVDDDSSDSPIEDWEEWYSSDDLSTKATRAAAAATTTATPAKEEEDTDDEKDPVPWNAICVVGIRVYSKDENLELRVVMEGGDLSEGGMGERGEADLDNAQANAGGQRVRKDELTSYETEREDKPIKEKKEKKRTDNGEESSVEKDKQESDADNKDAAKDKTDDTKTNEAKEATTDDKPDAVATDDKTDKDETPAPAPAPVDDGFGLAQYTTIVQKDDEEFEKASAPVTGGKAEALPSATTVVVDDTMMWG